MQRYALAIINHIVVVVTFGIALYFSVWRVSDGTINAYINNILAICAALIVDKMAINFIEKMEMGKVTIDNKFHLILYKILFANQTSIKTSLYLFYIFALVFSRMLTLDIALGVSDSIRGFFQSIAYSLILLVALDKFIENLVKDDKRIRKYKK